MKWLKDLFKRRCESIYDSYSGKTVRCGRRVGHNSDHFYVSWHWESCSYRWTNDTERKIKLG